MRLKNLWLRLVEPSPAVIGDIERGKAQLMASLMLGGMPMVATVALVARLAGTYLVAAHVWFVVGILVTAGLMVAYQMSKKGRYQQANLLVIGLASISVFIPAPFIGGMLSFNSLFYLVLVTLFSSLYQTTTVSIFIYIVHLVGILVAGSLIQDVAFQDVIIGPFCFNLFASGSILLFMNYHRRVNELQRAALIISEERHRMTSEVISDYAFHYRVEADGRIVLDWVTDSFERITGYNTRELSFENFAQIVCPEDQARLEGDRWLVINGEDNIGEYRILTRDGELRWLRIHRRPVWNTSHTQVIGGYGAVQDVTERKQTEAHKIKMALEQERQNTVSRFVRALSHDFRTLLATIETSRYLIEHKLSDQERNKVQNKLATIQGSVKHLAEQIDNLHMIAAVDDLLQTSVNLTGLLEELARSAQPKAEEKRITLQFEPALAAQPVKVDQSKLDWAIRQLLMNAITHTNPGGLIALRSNQRDDQVVIEVQDNGSGIEPEVISQMFEPFYRGDAARTVQRGGIGLGLTIVRMIIEAHQGSITVDSRVGQGSLFTIRLPLAVEAPQTKPVPV